MSREPMSEDSMVAALLRERDAYQRQNRADRAAQVTEQLRLRGYEDPEPAEDAPEDPEPAEAPGVDRTPPKGRRGASKRTT